MKLFLADARHLYYQDDESVDLVFVAPPWDKPSIVKKCRKEWSRVLRPNGRIAITWRYDIEVYDRDWKLLGRTSAPPQGEGVVGVKYRTSPAWAIRYLLERDPAEVVLDPCCGCGTIPGIAEELGKTGIGSDIDEGALEEARRRYPTTELTVAS